MIELSNGRNKCQEFGYDTSFSTIDTELEKELRRTRPLLKFDNAVCGWYSRNSDSLNLRADEMAETSKFSKQPKPNRDLYTAMCTGSLSENVRSRGARVTQNACKLHPSKSTGMQTLCRHIVWGGACRNVNLC